MPYEDQMAQDAWELKEVRLLQREKQLEIQAKALENAKLNATYDSSSMYSMGSSSGYAPYSPMMPPSSGRPLDGLLMELHAKMDCLIRMSPCSTNNSSSSLPLGAATDVHAVLRGVERLAGENEPLLLQLNSQNQQYTSYEKRCDEVVKQNQRLQQEKRLVDEKYQQIANQQLNVQSEVAT